MNPLIIGLVVVVVLVAVFVSMKKSNKPPLLTFAPAPVPYNMTSITPNVVTVGTSYIKQSTQTPQPVKASVLTPVLTPITATQIAPTVASPVRIL